MIGVNYVHVAQHHKNINPPAVAVPFRSISGD